MKRESKSRITLNPNLEPISKGQNSSTSESIISLLYLEINELRENLSSLHHTVTSIEKFMGCYEPQPECGDEDSCEKEKNEQNLRKISIDLNSLNKWFYDEKIRLSKLF